VEYLVGDLLEGYVRRSAHVTVGVCLSVCKTGGIDGALLARGVVRENHVCSLRSDDTPIDGSISGGPTQPASSSPAGRLRTPAAHVITR
jgi:hypothetical protein